MNRFVGGPTKESNRWASVGAPSVTVQRTCPWNQHISSTQIKLKPFSEKKKNLIDFQQPITEKHKIQRTCVSPRLKSADPCNTEKIPASQHRGLTSSSCLPSTLNPSAITLLRTTYIVWKYKHQSSTTWQGDNITL